MEKRSRWYHIFAETRTQVLLCYLGLMALLVGVSIPAMYHILFRQIDERARVQLQSELLEFREEIKAANLQDDAQLQAFVSEYLEDELVEHEQFLIVVLDQQFLGASPSDLPEAMGPDSALMRQWQQPDQPLAGQKKFVDSTVGSIIYKAEPIILQGQFRGRFVVATTTTSDRKRVVAAVHLVLFIMGSTLVVATLLAWLLSGKVLQPLHLLTQTTRSISESDLSQRLESQGRGEMAELAITFNSMMDRLQNAFQSQQNFINDASHELRTPITIIQGHLELMGEDPQEQAETIALVNDELERMKRLVSDMLLLAKAGQPNFLEPEWVEIGALTEELYQKASVLAGRHWVLDSKGSGIIRLDRQRVTQAVMNLVTNATQHTTEAGTIALGSVVTQNTLRLWVRDTGSGIPLNDQQRIFERFSRANSSKRHSEGAGLGLAIVQAIATASGGTVELESLPGHGSTFTLVLPLPGKLHAHFHQKKRFHKTYRGLASETTVRFSRSQTGVLGLLLLFGIPDKTLHDEAVMTFL